MAAANAGEHFPECLEDAIHGSRYRFRVFACDVLRKHLLPTSGGSLPIDLFETASKAPVIIFPIANHDNNQHAANENLRLQNLWDGIDVFAALAGCSEARFRRGREIPIVSGPSPGSINRRLGFSLR